MAILGAFGNSFYTISIKKYYD